MNYLINLLEKLLDKKPIIRYSEKQKGDVRDTLADTTKIENKLGWKPNTGVEDGLRRQIEWMKSIYQ